MDGEVDLNQTIMDIGKLGFAVQKQAITEAEPALAEAIELLNTDEFQTDNKLDGKKVAIFLEGINQKLENSKKR